MRSLVFCLIAFSLETQECFSEEKRTTTMSDTYTLSDIVNAIAAAGQALQERKDEVNRLNVFPVPDGDTGTNMSLTIKSVVDNLAALSSQATGAEVRRAITTGALMGARGNSGVITSQILRGLCEGAADAKELNIAAVDRALEASALTAFQAVRKPVEGTILTVLRDTAAAAHRAHKKKMSLDDGLSFIVSESYASVQRTPDLLPVLRENNVVDAGGFGLAILFDSFVSALQGKESPLNEAFSLVTSHAPKVEIEHINDWEGSAYRYCNEFLVDSETLDRNEALDFLSTMGDCELCVGDNPKFKVHVHSNHPDQVLAYFLERGQISEVFIHNMQLQADERTAKLAKETPKQRKPLGFVAVAAGKGTAAILESLGVDVVVSGGQTMNPSTKDLLDAVEAASADKVIILPNNKNIIMAAQSCAEVAEIPCEVVPTTSVLQSFSAMLVQDVNLSLSQNVEAMKEAIAEVKTAEITTAIKDSKDAHGNPIKDGDIIGITGGSIEAVSDSVERVALDLLEYLEAEDFDTLTILAGEDFTDDALQALIEDIEERYDEIEIDAHRGEQPLYPLVFSLE